MDAMKNFIGRWKSTVTVENADGSSQAYETTNEYAYLPGMEFVEDRAVGPDGKSGHLAIWRYDAGADTYHSTYFLSPGNQFIQFAYQWNSHEKTLLGEALMPDGSIMKAKDVILDEDTYTWEIVIHSPEDVPLSTIFGVQNRIKD